MLMITEPHSASAPAHERLPILVAVRGASSLNPALEWAARRARDTDRALMLVHAVPSADLMPPGTRYEPIVERGEALLQAEAARIEARLPGLRTTTYLHSGDVIHALVGLSAGASLLVVGADRMNTQTGVFQGSVAIEVALGSGAPVLIVPPGHRGGGQNGTGPGHVVTGVDGSAESYEALRRAAFEANRMRTPLRVVVAVRPSSPVDEARTVSTSAILAALRTAYPSLIVSWIVDTVHAPARALARHSRDASLLVIGRHGRGASSGIGLGSVAHAVLLRPPCLTLVIPSPNPTVENRRLGVPAREHVPTSEPKPLVRRAQSTTAATD
ncbi:universal stress protein [Arthrobacter sp. MDT3-44]